MIIANIHQAKTELSKLIDHALAGNEVIIAKANIPVVKLVKYKQKEAKNSYGVLKGKVWMSDDFNEEDPKINKMFGIE